MLGGEALMRRSRTPRIMADAAHWILTRPSREFTGNFCIDDAVLWDAGVRDFSKYAAVPGTRDADLQVDFFVPDDAPRVPR
jgi:citronellol/citronellal dehydrogenase